MGLSPSINSNSSLDRNSMITSRWWSAEAQSKQRFLGWLVLHQRTLTAENLLIRHWPCQWICHLCSSAFHHLFRDCAVTRRIWLEVANARHITAVTIPQNIDEWAALYKILHAKASGKGGCRCPNYNLVAYMVNEK